MILADRSGGVVAVGPGAVVLLSRREMRPKLFFMRVHPRVPVEALCTELVDDGERPGLVVDLSPEGLRIERPYLGGRIARELRLELEVPEVDEVIWARAAVCFDRVRPAPRGVHGGPFGFLRTTGLRIIGAAARDLRVLRDCVVELRRGQLAEETMLSSASCYLRG